MTDSRTSAFVCAVCGSVYPERSLLEQCEATAAEPGVYVRGTLIRPIGAGGGTGLGWLTGSYLLGLDDPRGEVHVRIYRANFLWGRADFKVDEFESLGEVCEAEWREAVARGDQ